MENEYFYFHSLISSQKYQISTNKNSKLENLKTLAKKHLFLKTGDRGASVNTSSFMMVVVVVIFFSEDRSTSAIPSSNGGGVRCDPGPQVGAFLGHWSSDSAALHLSFVVDDDTGVVFEVESDAVFAVIRFPLTNNHCWNHLFPEFGLSFFDRGHDHVADSSSWHSVQPRTKSSNRNNVKILGACVVGAIHDGSDWQSQRNAELSSGRTSTPSLRHIDLVFSSSKIYFKQIETTQL